VAASEGVARPYGAGGSSLGGLAWPDHAHVCGSGDAVAFRRGGGYIGLSEGAKTDYGSPVICRRF